MLFKVRKEESCDSCGGILIEVLDVLIDSNIIEIYLNPNDAAYSQIVSYLFWPNVKLCCKPGFYFDSKIFICYRLLIGILIASGFRANSS
jgi:hypothetical protein